MKIKLIGLAILLVSSLMVVGMVSANNNYSDLMCKKTPTFTPEPSDTPEPSETPEPSDTPEPSETPEPSDTPEPSETPVTPTETPTETPVTPTETPVTPTETPVTPRRTPTELPRTGSNKYLTGTEYSGIVMLPSIGEARLYSYSDWNMTGITNQFARFEGDNILLGVHVDTIPNITDFGVGDYVTVDNKAYIIESNFHVLPSAISILSDMDFDLAIITCAEGNNDMYGLREIFLGREANGSY